MNGNSTQRKEGASCQPCPEGGMKGWKSCLPTTRWRAESRRIAMRLSHYAGLAIMVVMERNKERWNASSWPTHKELSFVVLKRAVCALLFASLTSLALAQKPSRDLTEMDIEELLNIEVTSVSKKKQSLSKSPAAIYVLTQEDICCSGATSIPELLRMVPGLNVAQIDANKWAISARGFNRLFANKMLVLIDGRSVYTPLFSGVYWDVQDTLLEDVERIEVIRGPGATLWGANAVNGVINIITKSAKDTQGGLLTTGVGTQENGFGGLRYGGKLGDNAGYRFYTKYFNRDNSALLSGGEAADGWDMLRGGFRVDWTVSGDNSLTFQGDIYDGDVGGTPTITSLFPPFSKSISQEIKVRGGNVLGRWNRDLSDTSQIEFQVYYDRTERQEATPGEVRDTFDLDFQHRFAPGKGQGIVWGLGYRVSTDKTDGTFTLSFDPESRTDHLFSGFIQDEIMFIGDRLHLTLGSKFEHNDYTGLEVQPSMKFLWAFHDRQTLWGAVSRADRTPSRTHANIRINAAVFPGQGGLTLLSIFGNQNQKSEHLLAYELGYRSRPGQRISIDIATFYHRYHDLQSTEPSDPFFESSPTPPHLVVPLNFDNKLEGATYGAELSTNWHPTSLWRLSAGYSWLQVQLRPDPSSRDSGAELAEGTSPEHQFSVRSHLNLPRNLKLDTALYYVDRLATLNVPSYVRLDTRLGWHRSDAIAMSIGLQNLLDDRHLEFVDMHSRYKSPTQVKRSVYGKITWRF
ncbi:TonB-dependent receptor [Acidobacteria bacterium AH-259-A15]|nr:TonB-dependent receptor [Acidobacteria bacterium AH-259-A15]